MARRTGPHALTANDLLTGGVVWWTGKRWSAHYDEATRADDEGSRAALAATAVAEESDDNVVGATLVAIGAEGLPMGLREGRRLAGPSIALPTGVDDARVA